VSFHDFRDFTERYKGRKCPQPRKVSFTSVYDRFCMLWGCADRADGCKTSKCIHFAHFFCSIMCHFMIFATSRSATREGNVPNPEKSVLQAFTIGFACYEDSLTVPTGAKPQNASILHTFSAQLCVISWFSRLRGALQGKEMSPTPKSQFYKGLQ